MGQASRYTSSGLTRGVAVVTGASRGLGRAIALRLAQDGYRIAVLFERSIEQAEQVAREIRATGPEAMTIAVDVSNSKAVDEAVHKIMDQWNRIDILVCNAGIFSRSSIVDTSDEEFRRTFDVNVMGVFNFFRAVLPIMMSQRSGRVIAISSHNAKRGTGASSKATYAATKNAVESYTKGAAVEAAPYGVTVNCVSPGWIETGPPPAERSELQKKLLEGIPLGRPGEPREVAAAVAFLASEDAGYITGEILDINGGTWMD